MAGRSDFIQVHQLFCIPVSNSPAHAFKRQYVKELASIVFYFYVCPRSTSQKSFSSSFTKSIHYHRSREEFLKCSLLLRRSCGSLGFDRGKFLGNHGIIGGQFDCLFEILESSLLVLGAYVSHTTTIQSLGTVGVRGTGDVESRGGVADSVVPGFELDAEQGRVVVQRESESVKALLGGGGFVVQVWVLVEVSEALFVLFYAYVEAAGLEGLISKVLAVSGDLENGLGVEFGIAVLGVILVGVAHGIRLLDIGFLSLLAGKLAAVGNEGLLDGLVTGLRLEVLDLANQRFSVQNFTKHDMLAVKVGSRDGGNEELGTIGICPWLISQADQWSSKSNCGIRIERTGTSIGHGEEEWFLMLQREGFVFKFAAVDRLATSAVASSKVTTLAELAHSWTLEALEVMCQGSILT